jgi:hypothetical protein
MSEFEQPVNTNPQPRKAEKLAPAIAPHDPHVASRPGKIANAVHGAHNQGFTKGFFEPGKEIV